MMAGATQSYPECNPIGSVGIPLVRTNCLVEDVNTGEELPYYEIGELCFQGPTLMLGYYGQPDATDEVIKVRDDGKRWFCSGDLGYVTEDGIVYVTGRIKRIIMTKGRDEQVTKMFPDRIEKAIYTCDSVEMCCVIGVPDEKRINYPKAYVVLKKGQQKEITEEAILRQCRQNLPEYMVPEEISFVDDLPRTSRGKVDYRALEEMR